MPFIKNVAIFAKKSAPVTMSPKVSVGQQHTLFLNTANRVFSWGFNGNGQLGDNSITKRLTPVSILGAIKTFCHISGGTFFSTAIDKNGRVWAWGSNNAGQLGDNTAISKRTPVSVVGATKTFCKIDSGLFHSIAIDKNGRLWSWGSNSFGELGDNSITSRRTPVSVAGGVKTFCDVTVSHYHSLAIDKNGRLWGWGRNLYGELGDNSITSRLTPVSILGTVKTFCKISAGFYHSLAIDKNGRAWSWGYNNGGQLGDNSITSRLTPVSILGTVKTFCKISAGYSFSVAIDKNGRAWAWGENVYGELGDDTTTSKQTPISVRGVVKTFCEISAGWSQAQHRFVIAIDKNGKLWGWGSNVDGYLGDGTDSNPATPKKILGTTKTFCQVGSGYRNSSAIDKNGRVWCWGTGTNGQLGNNSATDRCTPVSIAGTVKTFCRITSSGSHTAAIDKNGRAWAWGQTLDGLLGNNQSGVGSFTTPVSVRGAVKTFCQITSSDIGANLVIDKNGRAWGWGHNTSGVIGDNSTTHRATPVSVCGSAKTFCKIDTFFYHAAAIDKNGRVWCWGGNGLYQLGDGTNIDKYTPVAIAGGLKTFCQIAAGSSHTFALDKNGRAWGWGLNSSVQLGDALAAGSFASTPVAVAGALKTFCKISAGDRHTVAIDKNGRVWGWGRGIEGQVGNNGANFVSTPVAVVGTLKTFCDISAGYTHTTAIDKNGQYWIWGTHLVNPPGAQFLLGNPYNTKTPVRVCVL